MYPKIEINTDNIVKNFNKLEELKEKKTTITLVTKMLAGNLEVVEKIIEKTNVENIADSHTSNLAIYNELPVKKWLIREPMLCEIEDVVKYADISFNSEYYIIKQLDIEAKRQNKIHNIILTYELGDLREGCNKKELYDLIKKCLSLKNIKIYGIASNLSCYGGVVPTKDNMKELKELAIDIEDKFNIKLEVVSGANTSSMLMIRNKELPKKINNIRIGEAILCGYNTNSCEKLEGFSQDTFILKAQIVEIKNKPSIPRGISYVDAEGNKTQFKDKGIRKKALVAVGDEETNIRELTPKDKAIEVLGGCSNYTVLDITDSKQNYRVGDIVEFNMSYFAILKSMISNYVYKEIK